MEASQLREADRRPQHSLMKWQTLVDLQASRLQRLAGPAGYCLLQLPGAAARRRRTQVSRRRWATGRTALMHPPGAAGTRPGRGRILRGSPAHRAEPAASGACNTRARRGMLWSKGWGGRRCRVGNAGRQAASASRNIAQGTARIHSTSGVHITGHARRELSTGCTSHRWSLKGLMPK
jgi:hypothetical protein